MCILERASNFPVSQCNGKCIFNLCHITSQPPITLIDTKAYVFPFAPSLAGYELFSGDFTYTWFFILSLLSAGSIYTYIALCVQCSIAPGLSIFLLIHLKSITYIIIFVFCFRYTSVDTKNDTLLYRTVLHCVVYKILIDVMRDRGNFVSVTCCSCGVDEILEITHQSQ